MPAMPIYEYYCPGKHRIYQFYARTLAQGRICPACPDDPSCGCARSSRRSPSWEAPGPRARGLPRPAAGLLEPGDDRMEAALGAMEREFSGVDENDPRAMGRMMRRMAELSGEKIEGEMEEVVRKLEEGADPDSLGEQLDGMPDAGPEGGAAHSGGAGRPRARRAAPTRDPKLHDYP